MTTDDLHVPDGFTRPERFSWAHARSAPAEPGVFLVWAGAGDDTLLYVGKASKLDRRLLLMRKGIRGVSSLTLFIAHQLDAGRVEGAGSKAIQEELSQLRVAWKVTSTAKRDKEQLMATLDPFCNRWYADRENALSLPRAWLIDHGEEYETCRDGWRITVPLGRKSADSASSPEWLKVAPGHTTVHIVDDVIRAIGEVHGVQSGDDGAVIRVEIFELTEPVGPAPHRPSEPSTTPDLGASRATPTIHSVPSEQALTLAEESRDRWPPGSPWSTDDRSYWVFQANPAQWNLIEHLPHMPPGTGDDWTASRYRSRMKAGDGVILWATGANGGIQGLARLTGVPKLQDRADFRPETVGEKEWRVPLIVTAHVKPPISRDAAREHPRLRDLSVLETPGLGTNQPATATQWRAVIIWDCRAGRGHLCWLASAGLKGCSHAQALSAGIP